MFSVYSICTSELQWSISMNNCNMDAENTTHYTSCYYLDKRHVFTPGGNDSYIHILIDFRISNIRASTISFPEICRYIVRIRIHSGYCILPPVGVWQKNFHGPCVLSSEFYHHVFIPHLICLDVYHSCSSISSHQKKKRIFKEVGP